MGKKKGSRKYQKWTEEEGLLTIAGWARDGLDEEQIAENIGVTRKTLYNWKTSQLPILHALKKGKEVVDRQVENALLKRALGYGYTETKIEESDIGNKTTTTTKEVIPDTTAQIFWLKNRKPDVWKNKPMLDDNDVLEKLDKVLDKIDSSF